MLKWIGLVVVVLAVLLVMGEHQFVKENAAMTAACRASKEMSSYRCSVDSTARVHRHRVILLAAFGAGLIAGGGHSR